MCTITALQLMKAARGSKVAEETEFGDRHFSHTARDKEQSGSDDSTVVFLYFNSNNKADCQIKEVIFTRPWYMNDHNSPGPGRPPSWPDHAPTT